MNLFNKQGIWESLTEEMKWTGI